MLHDEEDDYIVERKAKTGVVLGLFAAVSAVVLVLLITFSVNKKPEKKSGSTAKVQSQQAGNTDNEDLSTLENKRTSDELSFWHMYDEEEDLDFDGLGIEGIDEDGEDFDIEL